MELARRLHHHSHPSASGLAPRGLSLWNAMLISTMLADAATVNARVAAAVAEFRRHDAVYSCAAILHGGAGVWWSFFIIIHIARYGAHATASADLSYASDGSATARAAASSAAADGDGDGGGDVGDGDGDVSGWGQARRRWQRTR